MTESRLGAIARPVVSRLYALKRRYRIGDAFLDRHPALANRLMGMLSPFKSAEVTDVHGHVLRVDPGDYLGLTITREYEPEVTRYAQRVVRPGSTVLDIGANIGYFTILFAQLAGPDGSVHAFEPALANVELLTTNVSTNGYANVTVHPVAVGAESGAGRLRLSRENPGDHQLVGEPGEDTVDVDVVAVDALLPGIGPDLSLVKLDIQGAEPLALRGMWETLRTAGSLSLVCEYTAGPLDAVIGTGPGDGDTLLGLGFELRLLDPDGGARPASLAAVRELVERGGHVNVAFERGL